MSRLYTDNEALLKNQGVDIAMIGTHSFRKGIATFPVQSRYILEGEGGDQVCGRAATGIPLTDICFANIPAHFLTDENGITSEGWENILPGYSLFYPMSFREFIPYLLASLVHHRQYLRELQIGHPRHPLFLQYVWTSGILEKVKDSLGAGCNRNPTSKMFSTGVPPHLVLAIESQKCRQA